MREEMSVSDVPQKSCLNGVDDYLLEMVLNCLPIEDKFRFERLSKRIQSLILYRHKCLRISPMEPRFGSKLTFDKNVIFHKNMRQHYEVNCDILEKCLPKLKNLNELQLDSTLVVTDRLMDIMADNCRRLRSLSIGSIQEYYLSEESVKRFGSVCGQNIRILSIEVRFTRSKQFVNLLTFTTRLVSLKLDQLASPLLNLSGEIILPDLRHFECSNFLIENLIVFLEKYCKQLVSFKVKDKFLCNAQTLVRLISAFNGFCVLKTLELSLEFIEVAVPPEEEEFNVPDEMDINTPLIEMAKNCQKLRRLSIRLDAEQKFVSILSVFTQLSSLDITVIDNYSDDVLLSLGNWGLTKNLKRLNIDFDGLSDVSFQGVQTFLPCLETLVVKSLNISIDRTLEYISRLRHLRSLEISYKSATDEQITEVGVRQVVNKCKKIQRISIRNRLESKDKLSLKTLKWFKRFANGKPKMQFQFEFNAKDPEYYDKYLKQLPCNLKIVFRKEDKPVVLV